MADLSPEHTKFVAFEKYCQLCRYSETRETDDPCNECLTNPTNLGSVKPVNYEEK